MRALASRHRRLLAALFAAGAAALSLAAAHPHVRGVRVLVAARDLPAGTTLKASDVTVRTFPAGIVPAGAILAGTASTATTPARTAPGGMTPAGTAPVTPTPTGTVPGTTAPSGAAPSWTASAGAVPDETAPPGTAPEGTTPSEAAPAGTAPGGTAPAGTLPGGTSPVRAVSVGAADRAEGRVLSGPVRRGEPLTDVRLRSGGLLGRSSPGVVGAVAAPIRLADAAVARLLHVGDRVDILAARADAPLPARTVASAVPVIAVPKPGPDTDEGALIVVQTSRDQASVLARAAADSRLSVTILGE